MNVLSPVHFSSLKAIGLSPSHYEARVEEPFTPSRAMKIGTCVHMLVLGNQAGKNVVRYEGEKRVGKAWDIFEETNRGAEILTAPEWREADEIARAVMSDSVASELLHNCEREKPLKWEAYGLPCETGGIDAIGNGKLIDLKTTSSTEPRKWARQCWQMQYVAQLAWYQEGARANGLKADEVYIIGVETDRPFAVTCFRVTEASLEIGRKTLALWAERLKRALEDDHWPSYTQAILDLDPMPWMIDGGDDE